MQAFLKTLHTGIFISKLCYQNLVSVANLFFNMQRFGFKQCSQTYLYLDHGSAGIKCGSVYGMKLGCHQFIPVDMYMVKKLFATLK